MNEERKRQYFAELAPVYSRLTGNTTQDIFTKFLSEYSHSLAITSSSIIHDNASGPGTATQVLIEHAVSSNISPTIVATDYAPAMIHTLDDLKAANISTNRAWAKVSTKVCNSDDLSSFADEFFTHGISNFSLFTITNAVQSLRETYRTLRPSGTAAVLLWKRYAVQHLLAAAQDIVQGPGYAAKYAVPVNGPQYFERDVVPAQLVEAGFEEAKMKTWQIDLLVKEEQGEKWRGLVEFMTSTSVSAGSTKGWSDVEAQRWPEAIGQAMKEEAERDGGIRFEAWVTVATK